jgi:hypothetical protein
VIISLKTPMWSNPVKWRLGKFVSLLYCEDRDIYTVLPSRYNRFGHTVNAIDIDGDGKEDLMVLTGGFKPSPDNDTWVTENGANWL